MKECEARLNAPPAGPGERLLRDRNYAGSIFELVLLYFSLNRFERVEPETGRGMPDVIIRRRWRHRLSLEAAVVSSPSSAELAKSREFNRWLYREIVKAGMSIKGARIVIDASHESVLSSREAVALNPNRHDRGGEVTHPPSLTAWPPGLAAPGVRPCEAGHEFGWGRVGK